MDVDALSMDKRNDMMKKGLCFNCNKAGHISKFCPEKQKTSTSASSSTSPPSYAPSPTPQKRMNPKELMVHIRSVTAQMGPDEKEEFLNKAEKEGFLKGELPRHRFLLYLTCIVSPLKICNAIHYLFRYRYI